MDSWFDRGDMPETRRELHYGDRMMRCFVNRPRSVHALLERAVALRPSGVALICGEDEFTYGELDEAVARVAGGLRALGVAKGDRVAMVLGNSAEFVILRFAIARLGAVSVPLNIRHQLAENVHVLEDCAAKVVVHEESLARRVPKPGDLAALAQVVAVPRDGGDPFAGLPAAPPVRAAEAVGEEETATILYTSGTTGRPKGAMLTHLSIAHSVMHYASILRLTETDRALVAVPMSHVTGLVALVDAMVHCAGALVVMPAFHAAEFLALASRRRVTYSLIVPAMFNLCLLDPSFGDADLSAWRVCGYGGAIMPAPTIERIAARLPQLQLFNCYGATETTSPATILPSDQSVSRKDFVGLPVPCGEVIVMDGDGVEVPRGQPGEVCIGGAMVVPGYFNNPEATEREFRAGYWKSGDLGIMDSQGYLRVVDRLKDVINRGGYKVFASEVENVLLEHPKIIETAVVAKPCPVLGERVHAFVVTRESVDDSELRAHCARLLSDYKVPEAFHRLPDALPRNANGKVLKRTLRERLAD